MNLAGATIAQLTKSWQLKSYVRVIPKQFHCTPLSVGPGASRFSSPGNDFLVLYAGRNLATALAETVIRDRFEGLNTRRLFIEEVQDRVAVQVSTKLPLRLLDIRKGGCLKLGISTDVTGAKAQDEARAFSQYVHDETDVAGILYASRLTGENCVVVFDRAIEDHLVVDRVVAMERLKSLETALASLCIELIS
jgi:hypothetical protein